MYKDEKINSFARKRIIDYVNKNKISYSDIINYSIQFPARVLRKIISSEVLDEVASYKTQKTHYIHDIN